MSTVIDLLESLWSGLGCVGEVACYLLRFVSAFFRPRASLAARLLAAESQLAMCRRRVVQKQHPKPPAHRHLHRDRRWRFSGTTAGALAPEENLTFSANPAAWAAVLL